MPERVQADADRPSGCVVTPLQIELSVCEKYRIPYRVFVTWSDTARRLAIWAYLR